MSTVENNIRRWESEKLYKAFIRHLIESHRQTESIIAAFDTTNLAHLLDALDDQYVGK